MALNWPDAELLLMALFISTGLAFCVAIMICCHCFWKTERGPPPAAATRETDPEAGRQAEVVSPVLWETPDPKDAQQYGMIQTISAVSNQIPRRHSSHSFATAEMTTTWDDFHQCPICMEPFSFDDRVPKILNCQHTLCEPCVEALIQTDTEGTYATLVCPECRSTQRTLWQGMAHVPNNLTMLRYMEYRGQRDRWNKRSTRNVAHLTCETPLATHASQLALHLSSLNEPTLTSGSVVRFC